MTHKYPRLISREHTHTHISERASHKHSQEFFHYIHTHVAVYWRFDWCQTHNIHTYPRLIVCTNPHTARCVYIFRTYGSVSLTGMQRYTQLAYLSHHCGTNLCRHGRILDYCVTSVRRAPVFQYNVFALKKMIQFGSKSKKLFA